MSNKLGEFLLRVDAKDFSVTPYYDKFTNSTIIYTKDSPSFGRRINGNVTVFLGKNDESFCGVEVSGKVGC